MSVDWLAFAHLVIAVAFLSPFIDPVRNKWIIAFGWIACGGVIPLALIAGHIRGIPIAWRGEPYIRNSLTSPQRRVRLQGLRGGKR